MHGNKVVDYLAVFDKRISEDLAPFVHYLKYNVDVYPQNLELIMSVIAVISTIASSKESENFIVLNCGECIGISHHSKIFSDLEMISNCF